MHARVSPKHPTYETLQARLDSYVGWPGRYVPKTPEELAAAGFFYIGSADRVTCFQCGITLRDWEEEHDPVTEHQTHSDNCSFINKFNLSDLGVCERPGTNDKNQTKNTNVGHCRLTPAELNIEKEVCAALSDLGLDDQSDNFGDGACARLLISTEQHKPDTTDKLGEDEQYTHVQPLEMSCPNDAGPELTTESVCADEGRTRRRKNSKSHKSPHDYPLLEENRRLKEQSRCRGCRRQLATILFLPCGHLTTCEDCASQTEVCVCCGKTILGTVKTFRV